jgi:hypothetical protein
MLGRSRFPIEAKSDEAGVSRVMFATVAPVYIGLA